MRINAFSSPSYATAFEGTEWKKDLLDAVLNDNREIQWNSPKEFNDWYKHSKFPKGKFDSDARIWFGRLPQTDDPYVNRARKFATYVTHMGGNEKSGGPFTNDMGKSLREIFPDIGPTEDELKLLREREEDDMPIEELEARREAEKQSGYKPPYIFAITDQMLQYIVDIVRLWISRQDRYINTDFHRRELRDNIGGEAGQLFYNLHSSGQLNTPQQLMQYMLLAREKINNAPNDVIADQYEALEGTLQVALALATDNLLDESSEIYELWQDEADRLISQEERRNSVQPNIKEEWEEMPEEYNFSTKDMLNSAFRRQGHLKLAIFISLAKLYVKR